MIGRILGKRYEIIEKIGEGGMGLVYKAKCHLLNRYVAVKILRPELTEDEEFINKFKKESQSSACLSHPNIVNIYDVGMEDGIYYIVMEYVKGKTLKDIINERAPLSNNEIINISRQICMALEHAHNNNIIHRDIKPQNIMITDDGIVKVADFGIARASNSSTLTNTGNVFGSVYYISPEQARGGYTDEKTDIYSLGTVIYEMATAKVPFMAESPVVIALKHIQDNVIRPSEINSKISVSLEDIILKLLEKNPASRYESATAVIKDLNKSTASPNINLRPLQEDVNNATRVLPIIDDNYINDSKDKKPEKNRKTLHKGWIAVAVITLTAVIVSGMLMLSSGIFSRNSDIAVPDLIGKDEKTAEQMLREKGLNMDIADRPFDDKHPLGTVIESYPTAGMAVKKNFVIKIKVSGGTRKISVPELSGLVVSDAIKKLEDNGLKKANLIETTSDSVDKGKVIKSSPGTDVEVPAGTAVDLYVSKGQDIKVVKVPPLVGVTEDKVRGLLDAVNLKLAPVKYKSDSSKPNGVVLFQNIPMDTPVAEGAVIEIEVNKILPATT